MSDASQQVQVEAAFKIGGRAYGTESDELLIQKLEKLSSDPVKGNKTTEVQIATGKVNDTLSVTPGQLAFMMKSEIKALTGDHITNSFNSAAGVDGKEAHAIDMQRRVDSAQRIDEFRGAASRLINDPGLQADMNRNAPVVTQSLER